MNANVATVQDDAAPKRRSSRLKRILLLALIPLLIVLCLGSVTLTVMADRTTLLGVAYLQSVHTGNVWLAELMGDHFSDDRGWHQRFYGQDIQRDAGSLYDAELSDVSANREQTLSGQWVTMVRYKWRERGSSGPWHEGALRVKTDHWWIFTYIRAVEPIEP
jgi:hypothetical protein